MKVFKRKYISGDPAKLKDYSDAEVALMEVCNTLFRWFDVVVLVLFWVSLLCCGAGSVTCGELHW